MKKLKFHEDRRSIVPIHMRISRQSLLLIFFGFIVFGPRVMALDLTHLDEAETELTGLVADWQTAWDKTPNPENAKGLATSLQALGMIERQSGKPEKALAHLSTACDLLKKNAPELLPDASEAKAITLQDLGKLEDAEKNLRDVLTARRSSADPAKLVATLDHLALNLLYQGRYPEVGPLLDEAEAKIPENDVEFHARLASHRGRLFHTLGSYARAEMAFKQALAMHFKDPELRLSIKSQLALSQLRLGKIDEARAGTEAAVEEARVLFANARHRAVPYLTNLGAIALSQGELAVARASFQEALGISKNQFGPDHASLMGPLNNLGVVEQLLGEYRAAKTHLERAAALQALHLPVTHLRVAETQRNLARNALLTHAPDAFDHVRRATKIGLDLLDRLIREGSENQRLNFLERFDLVSLPCATGDAELIANVLLTSKARLLDTLLAGSKAEQRVTWQELQKSLSADSAFVDTCRYLSTETPAVLRYGAIVILPSGPPKWVTLGTDESLQQWLAAFHERLQWRSASSKKNTGPPPALKIRTILRALEREFWTPLSLPPEVAQTAFSPDSRLHFLPIAALLDSKNRPLCSRFLQITTVTSGRDLLNPKTHESLSEKPWTVLSISDFPKSKLPPNGDPLLSLLSTLEPMPGTAVEARKLKTLAPPGSTFLRNEQATEESLRSLKYAPVVLHLGCHAFFLHDSNSTRGLPIDFDEHSELLYAGGLVLYHGAEKRADDPRISDHDDLLYPAEISRLPLHGTRLVTLSSCESGEGTPVSGEGLLGLRRAFSIAGAKEVVVALWPVSDVSTPDFMERFYQLAIASNRPGQALWQTQRERLTFEKSDDDFELAVLRYAPFVLSQNSPLDIGPSISAPAIPVSSVSWRLLLVLIPLLLYGICRILKRT